VAPGRAHIAAKDFTVTYPWLEDARREFDRRLAGQRLAHACLLTGPQWLGKFELATQMAKALLCSQPLQREACGACRSCQLFASGAHPDFRLLTFEVNSKTDKLRNELVIEQVRDLNAAMQLTHGISPRKVAMIYPAESMNRNAANALLKTLEEPPGDVVLLLVAHDPSRLPATIRSRCQAIHVRLPDEPAALQWLVQTKGADSAAATAALRAAASRPLLAWQLLSSGQADQFASVASVLDGVAAGEKAVSEILELWSEMDAEQLWNWLSLIAAQHVRACFGMASGAAPNAPRSGRSSLQRADEISRLQSLADRNRQALPSSLRKDLLLRDWLIQWSALGGSKARPA
jgi:DNA polymerase-3 subunit delta'